MSLEKGTPVSESRCKKAVKRATTAISRLWDVGLKTGQAGRAGLEADWRVGGEMRLCPATVCRILLAATFPRATGE